jgi:16S rRNA (cytosine967-C5)-methyltransferase
VTASAARPGGRAGRRAGTDPRRAAYRILYRLDQGPLDLSAALDAALSEGEWDPRDRRLAAELAYGVARWRYRLDFALRTATGRRVKDLDRAARTLLRLGAYQLAFTDRIPAPAAVDETVRLAGRDPRLRGFVNGVLRRWAREGVPEPPADGDAPAPRLGLPDWLARRWRAALGATGAEARARHANTPAPLTLRVETARTTPDALAKALRAAGLTVTPSNVLPDALRVTGDRAVAAFPGYGEGWFYVQDEASQLVGRLVGARPGERVLDACAAPGGKTGQLAAAVGEAGEVVAVERDPGRIARLRDNLERLGLTHVKVVEGDAAELDDAALGGPFDRVLLDAPCTGLGVLGRHPEGKWWKTEDAVAACAQSQAHLLKRLADRVAPGGHLVYAVCSGEPEETRERVAAFLAARPDFSVLPAGRVLGALGAEWVAPDGTLDTTGNGEGLDGFFAVHMLRGAC